MTKLDAYESCLMLMQLAVAEISGREDLRSQLTRIRLKAAIVACKGNVNMEVYEEKILGPLQKKCRQCNGQGVEAYENDDGRLTRGAWCEACKGSGLEGYQADGEGNG